MGGKREYTAIFAIGAKLLGSFKGAMSAAHSRLRSLQTAAAGVGRSIMRFGALFSGLFAGLAAFGIGAIFKKIFEGADEAAEDAHTRTRRLTAALYAQNKLRAKGHDYVVAQTQEIFQHTEALAKQGVIGKGILDTAASNLAMARIGPKEIVKTTAALADVLVATKGVNATQEDMTTLAKAFGKGYLTGTVPRSMQQFIGNLTIAESKLLKQKAKAGDLAGTYKFLMDKMQAFAGENAKALKTPEGRIKALDNMVKIMSKHIGEASEESRAKMADTWRALLPEIEPFLIQAKQLTNEAMASVAVAIRKYAVPALRDFSKWAKGPGGEAWQKIKDAWSKMAGSIGKALSDQFKSLAGNGKTFGDVVVKAMEGVADFFKWVADNAPMIVRAIEGITIALIALSAAAFIEGNITIIGIAAALTAIAKVSGEYTKFQQLLEGQAVSDPDHFTKHWYLMGQTWTEVFAGMAGVVQWFRDIWTGAVNWMQNAWKEFKEDLAKFVVPQWVHTLSKFFGNQAAAMKPTVDALEEQRKAAEAAEYQQKQAYYDKYGRGITRTPTAVESSAAIAAARASSAPMLARPGGPKPSLLPAIATAPGATTFASNVLPIWQRTADAVQTDWRATMNDVIASTNTVPPAVQNVGMSIDASIINKISEAKSGWIDLTATMQTPISIPEAVPATAAAVPGHQHGGIFSSHHLAHIAERGPEAVIPLSRSGRARSLLNVAQRAVGGGSSIAHVNFAPSVVINGNATSTEQAAMDTKLRDLARDFVDQFKRAQTHERRLSYEGGYA